jgi:phosphotransferase system enzyme I (PtsI)
MMELFLKGIPASGGIAIGEAVVYHRTNIHIPKYTINRDVQTIDEEIQKLEAALLLTRNNLESLREELDTGKTSLEKAYLDSTILMIDDPTIRDRVSKKIRDSYLNIEWVFNEVIEEMAGKLEQAEDNYLRERAPDIISLGRNVLRNLMGKPDPEIPETSRDVIVVAHTLSPHEIVDLYKKKVAAFVTEIGGRTSHVAIMARDLKVPAVIGLRGVTARISTGDNIVVDGRVGTVVVEPERDTKALYLLKEKDLKRYEQELQKIEKESCILKDGERINLHANMDLEEEIELVQHCGCSGIGLFRTEYIFLNRSSLPGEDEQYEIYRRIFSQMHPHGVTTRVIDVGGDKRPDYMYRYEESNPFLGLRGIRYLLAHRDILKQQLRAILKASAFGSAKIMFPMVNDLDELRETLDVLEGCKNELTKESSPFDEQIAVGVMIETPSSVILLDEIAEFVDFFSVGTNDLIQYTLAIDRGNSMVSSEFDPLHPAILRSLKHIQQKAERRGIDLSICGEMAGDPLYSLLLIGLGYRTLSMGVMNIPIVKSIILQSTLEDARIVADQALASAVKEQTGTFIRREMISRFGHLEDYFR